jgi:hypothetical protein
MLIMLTVGAWALRLAEQQRLARWRKRKRLEAEEFRREKERNRKFREEDAEFRTNLARTQAQAQASYLNMVRALNDIRTVIQTTKEPREPKERN